MTQCDSNCSKCSSCEPKNEREVKILSYTKNVFLEEIDDVIICRLCKTSNIILPSGDKIFDVSVIKIINDIAYVYIDNYDKYVYSISIANDVLKIYETNDPDIFVLKRADRCTIKQLDTEDLYPLYDIELKEYIHDGKKMYRCNIFMTVASNDYSKNILSLDRDNSEQLIISAKSIIYDLDLVKDVFKGIYDESIKYIVYSNNMYKIEELGYFGITLFDVEKEEETILPYTILPRIQTIAYLSSDDICYVNGNMYKDGYIKVYNDTDEIISIAKRIIDGGTDREDKKMELSAKLEDSLNLTEEDMLVFEHGYVYHYISRFLLDNKNI